MAIVPKSLVFVLALTGNRLFPLVKIRQFNFGVATARFCEHLMGIKVPCAVSALVPTARFWCHRVKIIKSLCGISISKISSCVDANGCKSI